MSDHVDLDALVRALYSSADRDGDTSSILAALPGMIAELRDLRSKVRSLRKDRDLDAFGFEIERLSEERDHYREDVAYSDAVVSAAGALVTGYGPCECAEPDEPYCDPPCSYCTLARALDKHR